MGLAGGPGNAATSTPGILAQPPGGSGTGPFAPASGNQGTGSGASKGGANAGEGGASAVTAAASSAAASVSTGDAVAASPPSASARRPLSKRTLASLLSEVDPSSTFASPTGEGDDGQNGLHHHPQEQQLSQDVSDLLLDLADEFIDSVTHRACKMAKHRKGDRLEVKDVQLVLDRGWNIRVPVGGTGGLPLPPVRTRGAVGGSGGGQGANKP